MPIYTNNSTFPTSKFLLLDDANISSYADVKKFIFVLKEDKVIENMLKMINSNEKQHLFEMLSVHVLRLTFNSKYRKIIKQEIISNSISDLNEFVSILNYRIDLEKIKFILEGLQQNEDVEVVPEQFLKDIIIFTYKYLYVRLAKVIYCNSMDHLKETMDFTYHHNIFVKYSKQLENESYNVLHYAAMKEYIANYYKSFDTTDIDSIEKTMEELSMYSNDKRSQKYLNEIIIRNVQIKADLSSNKKNKLLLPLYHSIICVFYYRHNLELDLDDPYLIEQFKKFRLK